MRGMDYTVRLDAFEGPLDLLLFLIRRAEVEINDIPIASIASQYLGYLEQLGSVESGSIDIERAGEFLVMAATLMEIKSRMLAPPSQSPQPEAEQTPGEQGNRAEPSLDPRQELVRQLLEYKRFRDASDRLDRCKREWEDRFPAARAVAGKPEVDEAALAAEQTGPVDLDDIELIDLVEAFSRIIETIDMSRVGEHRVVMDDTPVELHAEDIVDRLSRLRLASADPAGSEMDFASVFEGRTRSEAIGLFLAVLELVKQQRVRVRQEAASAGHGRILLALADAGSTGDVPAPVGTAAESASGA